MNNTFTILASTFLVGFVAYNSLSRKTDISFDKIDKKVDRDFYEEELDKLAKELVGDIINVVLLDLLDEYDNESISYDECSICSTCSSFVNVEQIDS